MSQPLGRPSFLHSCSWALARGVRPIPLSVLYPSAAPSPRATCPGRLRTQHPAAWKRRNLRRAVYHLGEVVTPWRSWRGSPPLRSLVEGGRHGVGLLVYFRLIPEIVVKGFEEVEAHSYNCLTSITVNSSLKGGLYHSLSLVAPELCSEIEISSTAIPQPLFRLEPNIHLGAFLLSFPLSFWAHNRHPPCVQHSFSPQGWGTSRCQHNCHLQQAHNLEEVADLSVLSSWLHYQETWPK